MQNSKKIKNLVEYRGISSSYPKIQLRLHNLT